MSAIQAFVEIRPTEKQIMSPKKQTLQKKALHINTRVTPKFAMTVGMILLLGSGLSACNRGIKPEVNEPTKLVKLSQNVAVVSPVMTSSVSAKDKNDTGRLQVGLVPGVQTANGTMTLAVTASPDGKVSAQSLAGKGAWQIDLNESILSGVSISEDGNTAIISTKSAKMIALNTATGAMRWQTTLKGTVLAPALIHANRVIVMSNDGVVHGLSEQTGDVVWQFATQTPPISVRGSAMPTLLDDKTALIASSDGRLHAIDIATGVPAWSRRVGIPSGASEVERMTDVDATPTVDNGQLFAVSYSGQLVGVDLASRQILFIDDLASRSALAVADGAVVVTTLDGEVRALDRDTGATL